MKKSLILLLTLFVIGIMTGCGMSEEEAKEYVQASLDAAYKGEFDAFIEITDSTPEGAKAMYEENIVHTMEMAGFSEMNLSEELTEKYEQLFLELAKSADYTVGDATKGEDGNLTVEVMVRPMTIFEGIDVEVTEALLDKIAEMEEYPDDSEIIEMSFEEMYNVLTERMNNPVYGDEQVAVTINVHKNEEGMYAISEEDMLILDNALFATGQE